MEVIEGPLIEEGSMQIVEQEPTVAKPQPAFQPPPKMDEAAVRAAVMQAEALGEDPTRLKVSAVEKVEAPAQPAKAQAEPPVEVPEKFKKPNGEVDVEKLKTSTERLDEVLQKKKDDLQDVNKFVEEALRQYKAKENELRTLPNPARIAAQLPPQAMPQIPAMPQQLSDQQLEEMIANDLRVNPARTIAQLVELALEKRLQERLQPIEDDRRDNYIRGNLKELAEKDPRVVANLAAINAKLASDPDLWKLKNPHKAAWLEVKEDLRLGEPTQAQAQPRTPTAPVLGGGTPPPTPSSSTGQVDISTLLSVTKQVAADPRGSQKYDPKKWSELDKVAKQLFDRTR